MRQRATTIFALGAVLALASACGTAKAGTALPKGDEAADYVGGKFEQVMTALGNTITDTRDVTNAADVYVRFDDKWFHNVITSARTGSPESRASRNRSQKDPNEELDSLVPADGTVQYLYLGPVYRSLAPTPWVSMPKPDAGLALPCAWEGVLTACKMAGAVDAAFQADKRVVRGAKAVDGGRTELTVNVPFDVFLKKKVENLPPDLLAKVGPELRKTVIPTTITLNADGSLVSFVMDAKPQGDGHKLELRYDFRFTGKAGPQDLPKVPDASQVTVLGDQAAKEDFYRRLGDLQGRQ